MAAYDAGIAIRLLDLVTYGDVMGVVDVWTVTSRVERHTYTPFKGYFPEKRGRQSRSVATGFRERGGAGCLIRYSSLTLYSSGVVM